MPSVQLFCRIVMRLMNERTAAGLELPAATCSTRSRSWASSSRSASWTSIRCWPAACSCAVYVRERSGAGPAGRVLSSHTRSSLRGRSGPGVGRAASGADCDFQIPRITSTASASASTP
ncbi:MAG TPA: hypothetical protein VF032_00105 [Thermoleophilaceae bacterium]